MGQKEMEAFPFPPIHILLPFPFHPIISSRQMAREIIWDRKKIEREGIMKDGMRLGKHFTFPSQSYLHPSSFYCFLFVLAASPRELMVMRLTLDSGKGISKKHVLFLYHGLAYSFPWPHLSLSSLSYGQERKRSEVNGSLLFPSLFTCYHLILSEPHRSGGSSLSSLRSGEEVRIREWDVDKMALSLSYHSYLIQHLFILS